MIGDSSDKNDRSEQPTEPLLRVKTTFQLAPAWQQLWNAPLGEFDNCDAAPVIRIRLESQARSQDQMD